MKYRAEIDGLRALAVVPVILFHAGFELFSGGFVGVDVFFVISGYLITTLLMDDIEAGRFSIVTFYERRARRILPALYFVMLCSLPFAWMWLLPSPMKDFSQSIVAVSLFSSNFLFWLESGYFDAAAEIKPLLHTWSLAVEEQYYVLFPIFLFLAWRFGKNRLFWIIMVFAAISLVFSEWGSRNEAIANFYLAPARVWELFSGSIAAFIVRKRGVQKNNTLGMLGLAAIIFSIFAYDESTPFPSVYALVPVLGVVLLVLFAEKDTAVARLLSIKLFVGIGLISYSAYLWHQPLFAFARIRSLTEPSRLLMLVLSAVSLVLAAISWKFVELPFRKGGAFLKSRRSLFGCSVIGMVLFVSFGLIGHFESGFPQRFDFLESTVDWRDTSVCTTQYNQLNDTNFNIVQNCFTDNDKKNFILMGDSHAESISKELRAAIEGSGGQLITLLHNACLPIPGTSRLPLRKSCLASQDKYWAIAKQTGATIILSSRWRLNLVGPRFDNGEGGVEKGKFGKHFVVQDESANVFQYSFSQLSRLSSSNRIIILSQVPEAGWNVPNQVFKSHLADEYDGQITTDYDVYKTRNESVNNWLESLANVRNIDVLRVEDLVCSDKTKRCINVKDNVSFYRDDNHPTPVFAKMIAAHFMQLIST